MSVRRNLAWTILPLLIASSAAYAGKLDCKNASDQLRLDECAGKDFKASDAKLNEVYRALSAKTSQKGKASLQSAQRAWLAYRDAQCQFETMGTIDGSIHPMVYASCMDKLTQAQTKLLSAQLHCEEGDLSCGGQ
ncbi:lysozyme inhibitor LprI family protein [Caballeronia mineralivorans]|jgi:uncharacterized protein YecT (DUF1311 family)|uniref:lysozyme inhibitor LprI family protein n=1 Tax=Caballeronia mineralivorans TaxID=2010198 RepID=UPI0023F002CB|nr:lysozyme inhibitor LprI family protein [Caballeronia mineralivorans]MDB5780140.1 hypothetical protein [Caballeronia mineralivorans]